MVAEEFSDDIPRERTNEILVGQPIGTFLVRDSTTQSGYALAIKEANEVKRYLISYQHSTKKFKCGDVLSDSVEEAIRNYSSKKILSRRFIPAPKASYVALYNFQSQNENDLSFNRGDVLNFIRQKGSWMYCRTSDNCVGWVPSNYLTPFTPEVLSILRGQTSQDNISYCQMLKFIPLPAFAKVLKDRDPSFFIKGHLAIECGDEVEIRKIFPNGFCDVWRARDQNSGLVPINYLKIEYK